MLGRDGVRAEPRRDAAGRAHRLQLRELRVAVEAVTALPLERRRPVREHRVAMPGDDRRRALPPRPRGSRGSSTGSRRLAARSSSYVAPAGAKRELVGTVAGEGRVRVAVDEARDRREAAAVELLHLLAKRLQVAHPADGLDRAVADQDVGVLDDLDSAERGASDRRGVTRRRRDLCEVPDEEQAHRGRRPGSGITS